MSRLRSARLQSWADALENTMPTARHEYTQEELDEAVAAEREKYDVLFNAFHEACAAGALARREIDLALPAMREYARKNPKHHFSTDLTEQDPDGAHAWLERNDKPNTTDDRTSVRSI